MKDDKECAFIMDKRRSVDIDSEFDFELAKILSSEKYFLCYE